MEGWSSKNMVDAVIILNSRGIEVISFTNEKEMLEWVKKRENEMRQGAGYSSYQIVKIQKVDIAVELNVSIMP